MLMPSGVQVMKISRIASSSSILDSILFELYQTLLCLWADDGRDEMSRCDGLGKLVQLMQQINNGALDDQHQKLRMMACGCMLNLTNTNGELLYLKVNNFFMFS